MGLNLLLILLTLNYKFLGINFIASDYSQIVVSY